MKNKSRKRWSKLLLFSSMMFFSFCLSALAQEITVKGVVKSAEDNMPIPGVAVLLKGTSTGAVTDFDGLYTINAKAGDILTFTYLGMQDKSIKVTGSKLNVTMDSSLEDLEEVVVVGYGTVKKKELTGAVAQVKAEALEQFVTSDVANALQGQVAGVNIAAASGAPGEASDIQIRGVTSLSGSNTPLFVVNGIPQIGDPGLSSNEIETIDVLKDAASTAVYGARGAAGVILITTKQGKEGQMNIDFSYTYGVQSLGNKGTPLMNTQDNLTYEYNRNTYSNINFVPLIERFPSWVNNDNEFDDYVLNDLAEVKQYNLSVSGGTKSLTYNIVGGLFDQDGALVNSNFKRYNGRATTNYKTDNWNIQGSLGFTMEKNTRTANQLIVLASRYRPYFPAIDPSEETSDIGDSGGIRTPSVALNAALRQSDISNKDKINANITINRKLSNSFNFITRVGTNVTNTRRNIFKPAFFLYDVENDVLENDLTKSGVVGISSRATKFSWDASLYFKRKFGKHNLSLSGTFAIEEDSYESFDASIQGIENNSISVIDAGTINQAVNSGYNPDNTVPSSTDNYNKKTVGTLGRLQYNYAGKYLLSALIRQDGSSRFGSDYRWGTFPSISAGWNVSSEKFWKPIKPTINNLKLRLSHGTVGNDSFSDYEYASTIAPFGDYIFDVNDTEEQFGTAVTSYANSDVKWETSVSNNIGLDIGLLKSKITITADYYYTKKKDMLFPVTLPGSAGAYNNSLLTLNIGNMVNSGFELATVYNGNIGKSRLKIGGTFSTNNNEITKILPGVSVIPNQNVRLVNEPNATVSFIAEGYEAGAFLLYETNGIVKNDEQLAAYRELGGREDAQLGDLIYVDKNNNGEIDFGDRTYKGSGLPDYEVGLNLNYYIGNFDLSMNWYASIGAEVLNGNKADSYNYERHQDLVNMWTPNNPTSQIPIFRGNASSHFNYSGLTDLWLEDGDFIRLKQITLGYTLDKDVTEKIGMNSFRLFLSAQNALTITDYSGYDPEIGGNNVARRGVDTSRYPLAAVYSLGLKIDF